MEFAVATLGAEGPSKILDAGCADVSFPGFFDVLEKIVER
jgi:5-enolpyruvylshikimate-3-phosphate synthase